MLVELSAENIAIMERSALGFGPGFTAITGETGAGKSLLVGAISLCLGERADTTLIRDGASKALVQAVFEAGSEAVSVLSELGYELEPDNLIYLQREIAAEGRSQCRINGRMAPVSALKRIGDALADLHGQHEHQSLLDPSVHIDLLDKWIGRDALALREGCSRAYVGLQTAKTELAKLEQNAREREQRADLLRFQVEELTEAAISRGEIAALTQRAQMLKNAEAISIKLQDAAALLFAEDLSGKDKVGQAHKLLQSVAEIVPSAQQAAAALANAAEFISEAVVQIKELQSEIEDNPQELEEIAGRLDLYSRLRRKYGDTEEEMLDYLESAKIELAAIEGVDENKELLRSRIAELENEYGTVAQKLSSKRKEYAATLCAAVGNELRDLAMEHAKFNAQFKVAQPGPSGIDELEFLFSANLGEPEKQLARIASGGEISRTMLAIKTVLAGKAGVPTIIFDEVDAGLGGKTAASVAKKLQALASDYQVIVITHLPQIASKASSQYVIEKDVVNGRAITHARHLSPDERVQEIARMLAGDNIGSAAIENAKQLLK